MSSDGIAGGTGNRQQQYGEHQISYFDQAITSSHAISGRSETSQIDPQSHPLKSSEGSPPPTSATTSGSTSTPSSSEGLSSGGDGKHADPNRGSSSSGYHLPSHPQGEGWPVSVPEGMIPQSFVDPSLNVAASGTEVSFPDAADGRHNPPSFPSAIKLLVSNNVAGSIIGRAGQTISDLQTQSSARIKLSQTGDFYPGTQDRVCLVQGNVENVKLAVRLLLERLHMLQGQQHSQQASWQPKPNETSPDPTSFDFVVRLLVPITSCGMIIGKSGANIKHMEEASGVSSVRLSPKEGSDPNNPTAAIVSGTGERIVTLTGPTIETCLSCLCIVLDGMSVNQDICRYTNMTTSYSRLLVPSTYTPAQPGRPLLVVSSPTGEWDSSVQYDNFAGKRSSSQPDLCQGAVDQQRASPRIPLDSPGSSREVSMPQYSPAIPEGSLSYSSEMPLMMPSPARGPPSNPSTATTPMYLFPNPGTSQIEHPTIPNSSSAPDLLAMQFRENMRITNPPTSAPVDYTHFAPQLPQPTPPGFTAQVFVPDTLIGSILGRGGKTLNELQMHSNTRIRISQRGEYVPGTKNRIVTIRGPTAHSVSLAQYLMSQRMVLPPTATYSPQAAPPFLHPSQLHPSHMQQQVPQHQQPSLVAPSPQHPAGVPLAVSQQQALRESSFLQVEQPGSSIPASSSLSISRSTSTKDHPPQNS